MRRGLVASRVEAQRAIADGAVRVRGIPALRAATLVTPDSPISLAPDRPRFASRGGDKLDGALGRLDVVVAGRRWLDAGASTGGFTDRLLRGGARAVIAVDVGYGQLDWRLRNDERVTPLERTNVRHLTPEALPWLADGVAADLSFISLRVVMAALIVCARPSADLLLLVKPQFEVGRGRVPRGGVVRDPRLWREAVAEVVDAGARHGVGLAAVVPAEPPGPAGNREFFVHLRRGAGEGQEKIARAVAEAAGGAP